MNRPPYRTAVVPLALALVAGCASTQPTAPVREAGRAFQPAISKPGAAKAPAGFYRVVPGDTLYKIAFEHGLDPQDLAAWNDLPDPDRIRAGSLLRLRAPTGAGKTTSLPAVPQYRETALEERPLPATGRPVQAAPMESERAPAAQSWIWPAQGRLLATFDPPGNKGIDIAGQLGSPVLAAAPGRVVYAGDGLRGYGKLTIIKHDSRFLSAYAHQSRILVREGETVAQGQKIGEMGSTDADRVKLHFEIRVRGEPVDPLKFLPRPAES